MKNIFEDMKYFHHPTKFLSAHPPPTTELIVSSELSFAYFKIPNKWNNTVYTLFVFLAFFSWHITFEIHLCLGYSSSSHLLIAE